MSNVVKIEFVADAKQAKQSMELLTRVIQLSGGAFDRFGTLSKSNLDNVLKTLRGFRIISSRELARIRKEAKNASVDVVLNVRLNKNQISNSVNELNRVMAPRSVGMSKEDAGDINGMFSAMSSTIDRAKTSSEALRRSLSSLFATKVGRGTASTQEVKANLQALGVEILKTKSVYRGLKDELMTALSGLDTSTLTTYITASRNGFDNASRSANTLKIAIASLEEKMLQAAQSGQPINPRDVIALDNMKNKYQELTSVLGLIKSNDTLEALGADIRFVSDAMSDTSKITNFNQSIAALVSSLGTLNKKGNSGSGIASYLQDLDKANKKLNDYKAHVNSAGSSTDAAFRSNALQQVSGQADLLNSKYQSINDALRVMISESGILKNATVDIINDRDDQQGKDLAITITKVADSLAKVTAMRTNVSELLGSNAPIDQKVAAISALNREQQKLTTASSEASAAIAMTGRTDLLPLLNGMSALKTATSTSVSEYQSLTGALNQYKEALNAKDEKERSGASLQITNSKLYNSELTNQIMYLRQLAQAKQSLANNGYQANAPEITNLDNITSKVRNNLILAIRSGFSEGFSQIDLGVLSNSLNKVLNTGIGQSSKQEVSSITDLIVRLQSYSKETDFAKAKANALTEALGSLGNISETTAANSSRITSASQATATEFGRLANEGINLMSILSQYGHLLGLLPAELNALTNSVGTNVIEQKNFKTIAEQIGVPLSNASAAIKEYDASVSNTRRVMSDAINSIGSTNSAYSTHAGEVQRLKNEYGTLAATVSSAGNQLAAIAPRTGVIGVPADQAFMANNQGKQIIKQSVRIDGAKQAISDLQEIGVTSDKLKNKAKTLEAALKTPFKLDIGKASSDILKLVSEFDALALKTRSIKPVGDSGLLGSGQIQSAARGLDEYLAKGTTIANQLRIAFANSLQSVSITAKSIDFSHLKLPQLAGVGSLIQELESVMQKGLQASNQLTRAGQSANQLKTSAALTQAEVRTLSQVLKTAGVSSDYATRGLSEFASKLILGGHAMGLTDAQVKKYVSDINILIETLRRKNSALDAGRIAADKQSSTMAKLGAGVKQYASQLVTAVYQNSVFATSFAVLYGSVRLFKESISSLIELQKQSARAVAVTRDVTRTNAELADVFSGRLTGASREFGVSIEQGASILKEFGSAGVDAQVSLAAFESTLLAVIATEGEAAQFTRTVAGIFNILGDTIENTTDRLSSLKVINDTMVRAFKESQLELTELVQGFRFSSAAAKVVGVDFMELTALLQVLNNNMIKSGQAGRSLQTTFSNIARKTQQFEEAFDIKIDTSRGIDFIEILKQISKELSVGALTATEVQTIFHLLGLQGARSFLVLSQNIDEFERSLQDLKENSEGSAETTAGLKINTISGQLAILKQNALAAFREFVKPILGNNFENVLESVKTLNNGLDTLIFILQTPVARAINGFIVSVAILKVSILAAKIALEAYNIVSKSVAAGMMVNGVSVGFFKHSINQLTTAVSSSIRFLSGLSTATLGWAAVLIVAAIAIGSYIAKSIRAHKATRNLKQELLEIKTSIIDINEASNSYERLGKQLDIIRRRQASVNGSTSEYGNEIRTVLEKYGAGTDIANSALNRTNETLATTIDMLRERVRIEQISADLAVARLEAEESFTRNRAVTEIGVDRRFNNITNRGILGDIGDIFRSDGSSIIRDLDREEKIFNKFVGGFRTELIALSGLRDELERVTIEGLADGLNDQQLAAAQQAIVSPIGVTIGEFVDPNDIDAVRAALVNMRNGAVTLNQAVALLDPTNIDDFRRALEEMSRSRQGRRALSDMASSFELASSGILAGMQGLRDGFDAMSFSLTRFTSMLDETADRLLQFDSLRTSETNVFSTFNDELQYNIDESRFLLTQYRDELDNFSSNISVVDLFPGLSDQSMSGYASQSAVDLLGLINVDDLINGLISPTRSGRVSAEMGEHIRHMFASTDVRDAINDLADAPIQDFDRQMNRLQDTITAYHIDWSGFAGVDLGDGQIQELNLRYAENLNTFFAGFRSSFIDGVRNYTDLIQQSREFEELRNAQVNALRNAFDISNELGITSDEVINDLFDVLVPVSADSGQLDQLNRLLTGTIREGLSSAVDNIIDSVISGEGAFNIFDVLRIDGKIDSEDLPGVYSEIERAYGIVLDEAAKDDLEPVLLSLRLIGDDIDTSDLETSLANSLKSLRERQSVQTVSANFTVGESRSGIRDWIGTGDNAPQRLIEVATALQALGEGPIGDTFQSFGVSFGVMADRLSQSVGIMSQQRMTTDALLNTANRTEVVSLNSLTNLRDQNATLEAQIRLMDSVRTISERNALIQETSRQLAQAMLPGGDEGTDRITELRATLSGLIEEADRYQGLLQNQGLNRRNDRLQSLRSEYEAISNINSLAQKYTDFVGDREGLSRGMETIIGNYERAMTMLDVADQNNLDAIGVYTQLMSGLIDNAKQLYEAELELAQMRMRSSESALVMHRVETSRLRSARDLRDSYRDMVLAQRELSNAMQVVNADASMLVELQYNLTESQAEYNSNLRDLNIAELDRLDIYEDQASAVASIASAMSTLVDAASSNLTSVIDFRLERRPFTEAIDLARRFGISLQDGIPDNLNDRVLRSIREMPDAFMDATNQFDVLVSRYARFVQAQEEYNRQSARLAIQSAIVQRQMAEGYLEQNDFDSALSSYSNAISQIQTIAELAPESASAFLERVSADIDNVMEQRDRFNQAEDVVVGVLTYDLRTPVQDIDIFNNALTGVDITTQEFNNTINRASELYNELNTAFRDSALTLATSNADNMTSSLNSLTTTVLSLTDAYRDMNTVIGDAALRDVRVREHNPNRAISGSGHSIGGTIQRFATGGLLVPGNGSGDTVPAMLTPGEFVIPKIAASNLTRAQLEALRSGDMLKLTKLLGGKQYGRGGSVTVDLTNTSGNSGANTARDISVGVSIGDINISQSSLKDLSDALLNNNPNEIDFNSVNALQSVEAEIDQTASMQNILDDMLSKNESMFDNYISELELIMKDFNVSFSKRIGSAFNYAIAKTIGSNFRLFVDTIVEASGMLRGLLNSAFSLAQSASTSATDAASNVADGTTEDLERALRRNEITYYEYLDRLEDALRDSLDARNELVAESTDPSQFDSLVDALLGQVRSYGENLSSRMASEIMDMIKPVLEMIQSSFENMMGNALVQASLKINNMFSEFGNTITNSLSTLLENIDKNLILEMGNDLGKSIVGGMTGIMNGIPTTNTNDNTSPLLGIHSLLNDSFHSFMNGMSLVGDSFFNTIKSSGSAFGDKIESASNNMTNGITALTEMFRGSIIDKAMSTAEQIAINLFGNAGVVAGKNKSIQGDITPLGNSTSDKQIDWQFVYDRFNTDIIDPIKNIANNALDSIKSFAETIQSINEKISDYVTSFNPVESFRSLLDKFNNIDWDGISDSIKQGVLSIIDGIKNSFTAEGISDTLSVLGGYFKKGFKNAGTAAVYFTKILTKAAIQIGGMLLQFSALNEDQLNALVENIKNLPDAITAVADRIVKAIPTLVEAVISTIPKIVQSLAEALPKVVDALVDAVPELLVSLIKGISGILQAIMPEIPKLIKGIMTAVADAFPVLMKEIVNVVIALTQQLGPIFKSIFESLPDLIDGITEGLLVLIDSLPDIIVAIVEGLVNGIGYLVDNLDAIVVSLVKAFFKISWALTKLPFTIGYKLAKKLWNSFDEIAAWFGERIKNIFRIIGNSLLDVGKFLFKVLTYPLVLLNKLFEAMFGSLWTDIRDGIAWIVTGLFDLVLQGFQEITGWIGRQLSTFAGYLSEGGMYVWNLLKNGTSYLVDGLSNFFTNLWNGLKNILQTLNPFTNREGESRVGNAWDGVKEWVGGIFHEGGVVGQPGFSGIAKNGNEVISLLKVGEGVLTQRGLNTLGGKSVLDMLNAGINTTRLNQDFNQPAPVLTQTAIPTNSASTISNVNNQKNEFNITVSPVIYGNTNQTVADDIVNTMIKALAEAIRSKSDPRLNLAFSNLLKE